MAIATVETRLMTGEELLEIPHDGRRFELIEGELIEMTPAGGEHGGIQADIAIDLGIYLRQQSGDNSWKVIGAETGFRIAQNPDTVRAPDVALVSWERWEMQKQRGGYFEGAPDLAVEVVSPGDRATEVQDKALEWLEAGARLVWVVFPRSQRVTVYFPDGTSRILRASDTLDGGEVLPGFSLPVADIFR